MDHPPHQYRLRSETTTLSLTTLLQFRRRSYRIRRWHSMSKGLMNLYGTTGYYVCPYALAIQFLHLGLVSMMPCRSQSLNGFGQEDTEQGGATVYSSTNCRACG